MSTTARSKALQLLLFVSAQLLIIFTSKSSAQQQSCLLNHRFGNVVRSFKSCRNLGEQAATLSWTYIPLRNELDAMFTSTAPSSAGWVGWGINLGSAPLMFGSNVFVGFKASNGTSMIETYKITQANIAQLSPGALDFKVLDRAVEITGASMKLYMRIQLPKNKTSLNHLWNRGSGMSGVSPLPHGQNDVKSVGRINIASGSSSAAALPHQQLKNRHGIVNAVGWGLLLPLGVMSARYLKSFESADPAWFYIHAFCQSSGYVLGVVGWATGLKLGNYSESVRYKHRNLGIAIFAFATLQVLSLLLRPKKEHKVRKYWNVYHHTIGYATIAMIIVNIFEGLDILQPHKKWKHAYIGVIASLGGICLFLEIITWIIYFRKKSRATPADAAVMKSDHAANGSAAAKNWSNSSA